MKKDHPMLNSILSLAKIETWQSSIGLADYTASHWLDKIQPVDFERVVLTGCGSSLYNGQVGKYAFEQIAGLAAEAIPAFTFSRYTQPRLLNPRTLVIGISTTGETQAVCEALTHARRSGAKALAVTAYPDSPVRRVADAAVLTNGQSDTLSVKTSSYVQALIALYVLAIRLGERRTAAAGQADVLPKNGIVQISKAGELAAAFLEQGQSVICQLAEGFASTPKVFVLGCGPNCGTAEEAALKVIEMAKLYAEAQELENFFHGRLREVNQTTPLFFIAPRGLSSERMLDFLTVADHIQAPSVVLTDEITEGIRKLARYVIQMPEGLAELFTPLLYIIPLHLFSFELALARGYDPNARRYNIVPQKVKYGQPVQEL